MDNTPTGASAVTAGSGNSDPAPTLAPGSTSSGAGTASATPANESPTDDLIDVLSGSSVSTFLRCAKQWEFAYVYRLRRPPTLRLVVGSAGHTAVEGDMTQKMVTAVDLPEEDVLDSFSTAYDAEVVDTENTDVERGVAKDTGIRQMKYWHGNIAPDVDPMLVEEPIAFTIDDLTYTGTLDIADTKMRIRDWKFSQKTPSSGEAYLINMIGYAIGFRVATGVTERQVILDFVVGLKTKTKHVQFASEGPVPDASIKAFSGILRDVNQSVQAGIFPPTGIKSGACSWCGYKDICPAYKDSPLRGTTEDE